MRDLEATHDVKNRSGWSFVFRPLRFLMSQGFAFCIKECEEVQNKGEGILVDKYSTIE